MSDRKLIENITRKVKMPSRSGVIKAVAVTGGIASAIFMALKLKPDLYGPGGTKLSRYDPAVDRAKLRRKKSNASDD
ncbi:MAG TPA: hypothetical protein VM099_12945 [Gemmatimonadaceae bacterium]|nr:hypothetical protein [Gemmatimonadaceae bacterium]